MHYKVIIKAFIDIFYLISNQKQTNQVVCISEIPIQKPIKVNDINEVNNLNKVNEVNNVN